MKSRFTLRGVSTDVKHCAPVIGHLVFCITEISAITSELTDV